MAQDYTIPSSESTQPLDINDLLAVFPDDGANLRPLAYKVATILAALPNEVFQDKLHALIRAGQGVQIAYNDAANTFTISATDTNTTYTFALNGDVLTITPSTGSPTVLTLPSGGSGTGVQVGANLPSVNPPNGTFFLFNQDQNSFTSGKTVRNMADSADITSATKGDIVEWVSNGSKWVLRFDATTAVDTNTTYTLSFNATTNTLTLTPSTGTAQNVVLPRGGSRPKPFFSDFSFGARFTRTAVQTLSSLTVWHFEWESEGTFAICAPWDYLENIRNANRLGLKVGTSYWQLQITKVDREYYLLDTGTIEFDVTVERGMYASLANNASNVEIILYNRKPLGIWDRVTEATPLPGTGQLRLGDFGDIQEPVVNHTDKYGANLKATLDAIPNGDFVGWSITGSNGLVGLGEQYGTTSDADRIAFLYHPEHSALPEFVSGQTVTLYHFQPNEVPAVLFSHTSLSPVALAPHLFELVDNFPAVNPSLGKLIRFTADRSAMIPSHLTIKAEDGTTDVTSAVVGDEFRWDGAKWVRVGRLPADPTLTGDGRKLTLNRRGTDSVVTVPRPENFPSDFFVGEYNRTATSNDANVLRGNFKWESDTTITIHGRIHLINEIRVGRRLGVRHGSNYWQLAVTARSDVISIGADNISYTFTVNLELGSRSSMGALVTGVEFWLYSELPLGMWQRQSPSSGSIPNGYAKTEDLEDFTEVQISDRDWEGRNLKSTINGLAVGSFLGWSVTGTQTLVGLGKITAVDVGSGFTQVTIEPQHGRSFTYRVEQGVTFYNWAASDVPMVLMNSTQLSVVAQQGGVLVTNNFPWIDPLPETVLRFNAAQSTFTASKRVRDETNVNNVTSARVGDEFEWDGESWIRVFRLPDPPADPTLTQNGRKLTLNRRGTNSEVTLSRDAPFYADYPVATLNRWSPGVGETYSDLPAGRFMWDAVGKLYLRAPYEAALRIHGGGAIGIRVGTSYFQVGVTSIDNLQSTNNADGTREVALNVSLQRGTHSSLASNATGVQFVFHSQRPIGPFNRLNPGGAPAAGQAETSNFGVLSQFRVSNTSKFGENIRSTLASGAAVGRWVGFSLPGARGIVGLFKITSLSTSNSGFLDIYGDPVHRVDAPFFAGQEVTFFTWSDEEVPAFLVSDSAISTIALDGGILAGSNFPAFDPRIGTFFVFSAAQSSFTAGKTVRDETDANNVTAAAKADVFRWNGLKWIRVYVATTDTTYTFAVVGTELRITPAGGSTQALTLPSSGGGTGDVWSFDDNFPSTDPPNNRLLVFTAAQSSFTAGKTVRNEGNTGNVTSARLGDIFRFQSASGGRWIREYRAPAVPGAASTTVAGLVEFATDAEVRSAETDRVTSAAQLRGTQIAGQNVPIAVDMEVTPTDSSLDFPATRTRNTTGDPYDSTNKRWAVTDSARNEANLNWVAAELDFRRIALAFRLSQNQVSWACTVYWGCTTSDIRSDNQIRTATGGIGMWIGRPGSGDGTSDNFTTDGWNFFLTTSANTNPRAVADPVAFNGATSVDGASSNGKDSIQIPSSVLGDGPHDFLIVQFGRQVSLYANKQLYGRWTLSATEAAAATGSNLGIAGDSGSGTTKRIYLYSLYAGNPSLSLGRREFAPFVGTNEDFQDQLNETISVAGALGKTYDDASNTFTLTAQNTTYTFAISGTTLTITPSSGSAIVLTLPSSTTTTSPVIFADNLPSTDPANNTVLTFTAAQNTFTTGKTARDEADANNVTSANQGDVFQFQTSGSKWIRRYRAIQKLTTEEVQDIVGAFIQAGSNITVNYDDANNRLTIASTATGGSGSVWTFGDNFPSTDPANGVYLRFTAAQSSFTAGKTVKAENGTTDVTSANKGDIFQYATTGTTWTRRYQAIQQLTKEEIQDLLVNPFSINVGQVSYSDSQNVWRFMLSLASKAQAEAASLNNTLMTPLRVKELVDARGPVGQLIATGADFASSDFPISTSRTYTWTIAAGVTGYSDGANTVLNGPRLRPNGRVIGYYIQLVDGDDSDAVKDEVFMTWGPEGQTGLTVRLYYATGATNYVNIRYIGNPVSSTLFIPSFELTGSDTSNPNQLIGCFLRVYLWES